MEQIRPESSAVLFARYGNNLTPDQLDSFSKELLSILRKYLPTLLEHTVFETVFY